MPRSRVTLDISAKMDGHVSRLSEKMGTTKSGVIKSALSLFLAAETAKNDGFEVGAWKEDGKVRTERVFLLAT